MIVRAIHRQASHYKDRASVHAGISWLLPPVRALIIGEEEVTWNRKAQLESRQ